MTPRARKLALTSHVTFSLGWLGAVVAYLAVAITGLTSVDVELVRGTYLSMQVIIWFVIVPCAIAAFASGLVQSLATEWGLFRHYWIVAKLALTVLGTAILLLHGPRVSEMAVRAAESAMATGDHRQHRIALVIHAVGGLVLLLAMTTLSVFKPWGKTRYGKGDATARRRYVVIGVVGALALLVILHLTGVVGSGRH